MSLDNHLTLINQKGLWFLLILMTKTHQSHYYETLTTLYTF